MLPNHSCTHIQVQLLPSITHTNYHPYQVPPIPSTTHIKYHPYQVPLTPSNTNTNYHWHQVTLMWSISVTQMTLIHYIQRTSYPTYIIYNVHHTQRTSHTTYITYNVHHMQRTSYTTYIIYNIHHIQRTSYTTYIIYNVHHIQRTSYTAELCWMSLMTLLYWEWHLIPRWLLRSIFARIPEQLLNGLVSWGSHGKYSMTDCFLGDAFGVLSCSFWSAVLQCGARLPIHIINYWTVLSMVRVFLTGDVFECDLAHRRSVAVLWMLYKIRCNPIYPLYGALPVPYVPVRVTRIT